MKYSIFWFRRDLRLEDNTALFSAIENHKNVIPLFIFDDDILSELPIDDARVSFIYNTLENINVKLKEFGTSILCLKGKTVEVWRNLINTYSIAKVYVNKDYEPYAIKRDFNISELLGNHEIEFQSFKDQVIFEEKEIVKNDGLPYTVFTPYKNKWLSLFEKQMLKPLLNFQSFAKIIHPFPALQELGFTQSKIKVKSYDISRADGYSAKRDFPFIDATSYLSTHLRFGTISIRQVISELKPENSVFLSELIWREFFMQILFNFPKVINSNFRSKYDDIQWLNNMSDFDKWCSGKTGYPMVDAGMRQLNETGFMHNRVRMITAGFLCKHLLIDWRWGEAYFAKKLLDFELSSNNGNWQWAAGTGCDAAPYFRIFNPAEQLKKFDKSEEYVKKWVPEYNTNTYPKPIVEHKFARLRALEIYKSGIRD